MASLLAPSVLPPFCTAAAVTGLWRQLQSRSRAADERQHRDAHAERARRRRLPPHTLTAAQERRLLRRRVAHESWQAALEAVEADLAAKWSSVGPPPTDPPRDSCLPRPLFAQASASLTPPCCAV